MDETIQNQLKNCYFSESQKFVVNLFVEYYLSKLERAYCENDKLHKYIKKLQNDVLESESRVAEMKQLRKENEKLKVKLKSSSNMIRIISKKCSPTLFSKTSNSEFDSKFEEKTRAKCCDLEDKQSMCPLKTQQMKKTSQNLSIPNCLGNVVPKQKLLNANQSKENSKRLHPKKSPTPKIYVKNMPDSITKYKADSKQVVSVESGTKISLPKVKKEKINLKSKSENKENEDNWKFTKLQNFAVKKTSTATNTLKKVASPANNQKSFASAKLTNNLNPISVTSSVKKNNNFVQLTPIQEHDLNSTFIIS